MALSGSLVDFPLEGVLRLLESTRKTGLLEVSAEGELGTLEVTEGALTSARYGDDAGEIALAVILGMRDGSFAFRSGATGEPNLTGSIDAALEHARAERERQDAIRRTIPDDRMRFELSERALAGGPITIEPDRWKVLLNVDGKRDVLALAALLGQGRLATLRQLHDLVNAGLVDVREPLPEPEPEPAPPVPFARAPEAPAARAAETFAPPPETFAPEPAAPAWQPPRWSEPAPAEPPVTEAPAAPAFEAPPATPAWPVSEPVEPATDDLSKLLESRLAGLQQPRTSTSPEDFWEQMQSQREAAAPPPAPPALEPKAEPAPRSTSDTDDRLSALFGNAAVAEPPAAPPAAPAEVPSVEQPAPAPSAPMREEPVASHWLPADTTAPILEAETAATAPKEEKKRGGLFGFGRKKETVTAAPPTRLAGAPAASSPGRLASFANALLTEYNSGQYGKQRLDERLNVRLRLVDEQADPLDRMLPVQDDRLDVSAIDREFAAAQASPYLATLVRQLFEDAERVFGKDKAKKGYRAAVKNALGDDESILHDAVVAPILPKI